MISEKMKHQIRGMSSRVRKGQIKSQEKKKDDLLNKEELNQEEKALLEQIKEYLSALRKY